MAAIVTITLSPCVDTTIWVNEWLPEKKLKATKTEHEAGGGGINIARALTYFGHPVHSVFFSAGPQGDFLQQLLNTDKVSYTAITTAGNTRNNLLIIDQSTQLEYRIGMPANLVTTDHVQHLLQAIQTLQPSVLVLSGSIPESVPNHFFQQLATLATSMQAKLVVDTSGPALQQVIQHPVHLIKPNLNELSILCNIPENSNIETIKTAATALLKTLSVQAIAVSLGKDGALLITPHEHIYQPAPALQVKSTVGAGDCMVAAMCMAIQQNADWKTTLQYGVAAGSAATQNSGEGLITHQQFTNMLQVVKQL